MSMPITQDDLDRAIRRGDLAPGTTLALFRDMSYDAQTDALFPAADVWVDEFNTFAGSYPLDDIVVMDEFGELSCLMD